jgi:hypothetical protein
MATETKAKIHTVYKTIDGARVPSVTTILGILNKPALLDWAWKCGVDGLDYKTVRDTAAGAGTLAHSMIQSHLSGTTCDTSEYSQQDIEKAENAVIKFYNWLDQNPIRPLNLEFALVHEELKYGGTIDCLAQRVDTGDIVLIDFKTGKAIYSDMFYQLSAYEELLRHNNISFSRSMILRIGRDESEGFEVRESGNLSAHFELFKHALAIYRLQGELRRTK